MAVRRTRIVDAANRGEYRRWEHNSVQPKVTSIGAHPESALENRVRPGTIHDGLHGTSRGCSEQLNSEPVGVFEVSSSPLSICYSTQSFPDRPISILARPSSGVLAQAEVSYAPRNNDFCDRRVSPNLAAALIADPSGYQVR